jgi:type 1 glutamine amidotransferase
MILVPLLVTECTIRQKAGDKNILVVTGGHAYDTTEFFEMFDSMEGLDYEHALKPDVWKLLEEGKEFDAMVFYDMWQEIGEKEKELYLGEFRKGTGMVFLHHSLASHQGWPEYIDLVGGKYYVPRYTEDSTKFSAFRHDITLRVEVLDPGHPVSAGMEDFQILDEGYSHVEVLPGVRPVLGTEHPDCDPVIGWAHKVKNSRVVYLMGGHDRHAYENESFRRLVENAIRWTAENPDRD